MLRKDLGVLGIVEFVCKMVTVCLGSERQVFGVLVWRKGSRWRGEADVRREDATQEPRAATQTVPEYMIVEGLSNWQCQGFAIPVLEGTVFPMRATRTAQMMTVVRTVRITFQDTRATVRLDNPTPCTRNPLSLGAFSRRCPVPPSRSVPVLTPWRSVPSNMDVPEILRASLSLKPAN